MLSSNYKGLFVKTNTSKPIYGTVIKDIGQYVVLLNSRSLYNKRVIAVIDEALNELTNEEKRLLLDSFAGKYVSVRWIKNNGEHTTRTIQHLQHDLFTNGHASLALSNPVQHKEQYYTCVDVNRKKWININLNTLYFIKCGNFEAQL